MQKAQSCELRKGIDSQISEFRTKKGFSGWLEVQWTFTSHLQCGLALIDRKNKSRKVRPLVIRIVLCVVRPRQILFFRV